MPTFKIEGQIYMSRIFQLANNVPKFLQMYFVADNLQQTQTAMDHIRNLERRLEIRPMFKQIALYLKRICIFSS